MNHVYLIRSIADPSQIHIGATSDLKQRIADDSSGKSTHTSKFTPRELEFYLAFPEKTAAYEFEKYLKTHSGRAFANKRLMRQP